MGRYPLIFTLSQYVSIKIKSFIYFFDTVYVVVLSRSVVLKFQFSAIKIEHYSFLTIKRFADFHDFDEFCKNLNLKRRGKKIILMHES